MTDLERAQSIIRSFEPVVHPAMREVFVKCMAHSLAAARREGAEQASGEIHALRKALHEETMKRLASAEEMRERAAQLAFDQTSDVPMPGDWNEACGHIGDSIRALPLTPEEPT